MTSRIFPQLMKRFYGPQTSANSHTKIRVFRTPNNDFDLLTKGFKLSGAKFESSHTKIRVFRTPNNDFDLLTKGFKLSGAKFESYFILI